MMSDGKYVVGESLVDFAEDSVEFWPCNDTERAADHFLYLRIPYEADGQYLTRDQATRLRDELSGYLDAYPFTLPEGTEAIRDKDGDLWQPLIGSGGTWECVSGMAADTDLAGLVQNFGPLTCLAVIVSHGMGG